MKKRILSLLIVFCMVLSLITYMPITTVNASNTANELVSVAKGELGNGYSKYTHYVGSIGGRYDYAWCAAFVSWCGNQAGVSCIGKTASCYSQYQYMISHGGYEVATPQAGDVVFFYCNKCSDPVYRWCHVGIMVDANTSIDGNYNSRVSYDTSYSHTGNLGYKHSVTKKYVRPNYGQISTVLPGIVDTSWNVPTNVTASRRISTYDQYGNAESNHNIDPGDNCYISEVYTNGFVKIQYPVSGGTRWAFAKAADFALKKKDVAVAKLPGTVDTTWNVPTNVTASRRISTYDQWGNVESNHYIDPGDNCYISEVYTNGFVKIQYPVSGGTRWAYAKAADFMLKKKEQGPGKTNVYCSVGSGYANTTFSWDKASNASTYDLKIWKDKLWQGDAYQILWNLSGTSAQVCLPPGYYEAYVDSRNGSLINMSNNVVKFTVSNGSPVNLGNDLYATIITNKNQLAFTNTNGNVDVRKQDGSAKQVWRFKRQSDGSYTIQNTADSKYLDTDNSRDANGTNIKTWSYNGSDAQKYYVYGSKSGEYILKPKCAVRVVDVCGGKNNPGDNVQLWDFNGGDAQRLSIVKTNNPIKTECAHKYGAWTTVKKATCSSNGSEQRKCSLCGKIETRTIKAIGHKYTDKVIAATTTQRGYTLHTCKICGYSYKSDYTEYTKQLSYILVTVKPNKTEYYLSEKIDTTGMKVIAGYLDKTKREVTDWTISGDTSKEGNSWVIVKYTENGKTVSTYYRIVVKKRTDERITITYDSCGGDLGVKNRGGVIGVTTSVWSEIPKKNYQLTLDPNGGTISKKKISINAPFIAWYTSPGAKGTRYNTGQTVSFKNSMTLYAAYGKASVGNLPSPSQDGYIFEGWYLSDGTKVTSSTQISDSCTLTAKWQEEVKETPHVHTPGEWETVREATMTIPGEQVLRCQECGQIMQTEAIPILIVTDTDSKDDTLMDEDIVADDPVTDDTEFDLKGDLTYDSDEDPEEETFSVGDEITTNTEIFTVTKLGDNPCVEYTELFDEDVTDVAIPESITIYGVTYKVTSIAPKAFYKNTSIKSVTLTSSVTKIGSKAFYGCTLLKNIMIFSPKLNSNSIGTNAFTKVAKNVKVYVPGEKYKTYKKMLKKAGIGSKAKIYRISLNL